MSINETLDALVSKIAGKISEAFQKARDDQTGPSDLSTPQEKVQRMKPIPTDHPNPEIKAKLIAAAEARDIYVALKTAKKEAEVAKRTFIRNAVEAYQLRMRYAGNTTIAFQVGTGKPVEGLEHEYHPRVLSVATALCNPNDEYSELEGRYLAVKNWVEGKRINLKTPADFDSALDFIDFLAASVDDMTGVPEPLVPAMRRIRDSFIPVSISIGNSAGCQSCAR